MPIATYGAIKNLTPDEMKSLGAQILLSNTYHLWLRPGTEIIKRSGGLHKFMNWDGPILTDSGGFQVFSLSRHRKISEDGVEFCNPSDGKKCFMTPEQSIQIQLDLRSDIIMVFDECPAFPATRQEVERAVTRTTEWAKRCKDYFDKKIPPNFPLQKGGTPSFFKGGLGWINRPLLFGIVQGGVYKDLRQQSARELLEIGFDGYAIGGVAVGEPRKYLRDVLKWVLPILPEDKPRYLMGLGKPEEIVSAVQAGIDMFDCVIPTREARHGRLYKFSIFPPTGDLLKGDNFQFSKNIKEKFYETLQITNEKFKKDTRPIDENCACYACQNFSRAYLNHLFKIREGLGLRLATIHNLKFYLDLMEKLRG